MANTADILNIIRADLITWMEEEGYGTNVYLAEAKIDEAIGPYAIQLIAGSESSVHPQSGVGMIRANLDVVIWWRGLLDYAGRGDYRIAGTEGIEQFVAALRTHLTQTRYNGMLVALLFRSGGTLEAEPEMDGWLTMRDSYDYCYEMTWGS